MHLVELTPAGEEAFQRMRRAAFAFDASLRAGFGEDELAEFERVLDRLRDTSRSPGRAGGPPGPGMQARPAAGPARPSRRGAVRHFLAVA